MTDGTAAEARARAERLRANIRRFCVERMPAALLSKSARHQVLDKADYLQWMKLLEQQGWGVGHWPEAYGGAGWSTLERFAFEDELARHGCPWVIPFGVKYVGPVIYTYGSEAQKQRFLPRIVSSEDFWAQGYSEPGAGSDLAALRTEAVRDGDHYRVSGQKVWTTYAQWADWLFCLVRTNRDVRPQDGISFLLIDMRSPGITVKPIATMDGYHHVNEVWLDDVRVPVDNLVGEEGAGWTYAKFLLRNERTAGAMVGMVQHALARLKALAAPTPALRARIGELALRAFALEECAYQAMEAMLEGRENGAEASLIKLRGTELYQEVAEALVEGLGPAGIAWDAAALHRADAPPLGPDDAGGIVKDHFYNRAATIFGGSSEVQRNILAKAVLGL
ncbi:acyl-CoA dehydrogenase family protein [Piscinibacter sp.]|uniref:acyl-CoA dehydrogenase family protein n=1 Tax=Piscinibacter sp. TaxID=1903157 RepID=UPI002CFC8059|nr:acyl-CoA dehydrogenase family protein [Albitalea sp.]HUG22171.1 acyl-CoA dehydrogenase family protein [Albitalea sp.]